MPFLLIYVSRSLAHKIRFGAQNINQTQNNLIQSGLILTLEQRNHLPANSISHHIHRSITGVLTESNSLFASKLQNLAFADSEKRSDNANRWINKGRLTRTHPDQPLWSAPA